MRLCRYSFSLILVFISLIIGSCQNDNTIIGTWELEKTDDHLDSEFDTELQNIFSDKYEKKSKKIVTLMCFKSDSNVHINQGENHYKAHYNIKNNILTIGNRTYTVIQLNNDSLVFKDKGALFETTYYYFKTTEQITLIKEFEDFSENYSNGQIKTKGTYHNGFRNGLWEEWFENGQKKSEIKYKDGIPQGLWKEWDENGKLIKNKK